jgi:hypothetical protein
MPRWRRKQETGPGDEQQSKKSRNVYSRFPLNWGFVEKTDYMQQQ